MQYLAFANGILDTQNQEFTAGHNRQLYLTRALPFDFDPSAQCPTWMSCLHDWFESDNQRKALQAWFRFILSEWDREQLSPIQKALILFGSPGCGKGTALSVLRALVGSNNCGSARPSDFSSPTALFSNLGKLVCIDGDAKKALLDVGIFNSVVTNEPVPVKQLYVGEYSATLGTVVVQAMNRTVRLPHDDDGFWSRIFILQFKSCNYRLRGDSNLTQKLHAELSGIFTWAWQLTLSESIQTIRGLALTPEFAEAVREMRQDSNSIFEFLTEKFPSGKLCVKASELYQEWREWAKDHEVAPGKPSTFTAGLRSLGCQQIRTSVFRGWDIPPAEKLGRDIEEIHPKSKSEEELSEGQTL